VFVVDDKLAFVNDYSNSFSLAYIFIIAFFLGGFYPSYSKSVINDLIVDLHVKNDIILEHSKLAHRVLEIICIVLPLCGIFSVHIASSQENMYWLQHISTGGFYYYSIILGITWYCSANLAFSSTFFCIEVNKIFKQKEFFSLDKNAYDNCFNLKRCSEILILNISLGIYYILGVVVIILTDINSFRSFGVKNLFVEYPFLVIVAFIILIGYFAIVIISLIECRNIALNEKKRLIIECNNKIVEQETSPNKDSTSLEQLYNERSRLLGIDETLIKSVSGKIIIFFSAFIPVIGIIGNIVSIFTKSLEKN
jgi:hypothetical protein